jgi:uncharacterized protein
MKPPARIELVPGVFAHASGLLYLAQEETALAADLHLGYGWAQRRRGQLGPLAEGSAAELVLHAATQLAARRLVLLGDIVHAPHPAAEERTAIEQALRTLAQAFQLVCVLGNHDRRFAEDFASLKLDCRTQWESPALIAIHGDKLPLAARNYTALGHFHPAATIRDAVHVRRRLPCFLASPYAVVLPAISPFAAGSDVRRALPAELKSFLGPGRRILLASGRAILELPR